MAHRYGLATVRPASSPDPSVIGQPRTVNVTVGAVPRRLAR
jgi:hypothetical protein